MIAPSAAPPRGRAWAAAFLALFLGMSLASCGAKSAEHPEELRIVVEGFMAQLELKKYDAALACVEPAKRVEFLEHIDQLGERVTMAESEIRSLDVPSGENRPKGKPLTATVLVSYKIVRPPSTIVKSEHRSQKWVFSKDDKRWYLTEGW